MKGLELARQYYQTYGRDMLETRFGSYIKYMAMGLVGEGSECYGYDDEYSRDHDFGPDFCIWMPYKVYKEIGKDVSRAYRELPGEFRGFEMQPQQLEVMRRGVIPLEEFYFKYTACHDVPDSNVKWLKIPENFLSIATNGEIWEDRLGEMTRIREALLDFYPEDVLRKKLAARAAIMAQAGQYNYGRCMKRGDIPAAYLACHKFVDAALSAVFLLNRVYMPYYKWSFRAAQELPEMKMTVDKLSALTKISDKMENAKLKEAIIEDICKDVGRALNAQGFSRSHDAFLQMHLEDIMSGIKDPVIRSMHVMAE
ncbi:MAG: DUF4037 domain-containing protein [Anaerovoracaceae bacterium]